MEAKTAREVVKILLMKSNISLSKLARMMSNENKKVYQQSLSAKLINGTLKYNEMVEICELIGYEIIFKQK